MAVAAQVSRAGRTEIGPDRSSCWGEVTLGAERPTIAGAKAHSGFWAVAFLYLVVSMGATLQGPLYVLYQDRWHFSGFVLTLIYAAFPIGVLVTLILFGGLADRIGRRPVLVATTILAAISAVSFLLANGVAVLYAGRAIGGLAGGLAQGAAAAALIDLAPRHSRRLATVVTTAATLGGFALGGLLAGVVTTLAAAPLESVYAVYLILLLAATTGFPSHPQWRRTRVEWTAATARSDQSPTRPSGCGDRCGDIRDRRPCPSGVLRISRVHLFAYQPERAQPSHLGDDGLRRLLRRGRCPACSRTTDYPSGTCGRPFVLLAGLTTLIAALDARSLLGFTFATLTCGAGAGLTWMSGLATVSATAVEHRAGILSTFYVIAYVGLVIPLVLAGAAMLWASPMEVVIGFSLVISVLAGGGAGYLWRNEAAAPLIAEPSPPAG